MTESYISYKNVTIAVSTSPVELKCDITRDYRRKAISIYNDSTVVIYIGPASVTATGANKGTPLFPKQTRFMGVGNVAVFAIAASGTNNVIVQELA